MKKQKHPYCPKCFAGPEQKLSKMLRAYINIPGKNEGKKGRILKPIGWYCQVCDYFMKGKG